MLTPARHGGNLQAAALGAGCDVDQILDFSANINPLGPPPWLSCTISAAVSSIAHYPDAQYANLINAISRRLQVRPEQVLVGNGTADLISQIPLAVGAARAIVPGPAYVDYAWSAQNAGLEVETFLLDERRGFALDLELLEDRLRGGELVFIGQPNNPTGLYSDSAALRSLAQGHPQTTFLVDEAFAEFVPELESLTNNRPANVIVLCSPTKFYAIPGLRLGYAVADRKIAQRIKQRQTPWSVNCLALAVGETIEHDPQIEQYREATRRLVREQRDYLIGELKNIPGITVFPGSANFLLARIDHPRLNAQSLAERMLRKRIAIRVAHNFAGLDERYFRIAVRNAADNREFCRVLRACVQSMGSEGDSVTTPPIDRLSSRSRRSTSPSKPAVMLQGTNSGAGKSILATALCRILLQDGYRVAPFKAQNMALNSCVARGGEIGRAQALQAQACRLEPEVRMNPILLKPNSDVGSQVIVLGQPVGNMEVSQYLAYKSRALETVRGAYDALAAENEVMVLEGAGSPAEVNLKRYDLVNMTMAAYAQAKVLLVGDIDRGGVFAALAGTMQLLDEAEQRMVTGLLINRFRGRQELLGEALDFVARFTGRPVLGVVPYLADLNLPEEDSVSFKNGDFDAGGSKSGVIKIAIVDLPHISNFTDFDPLRIEPDLRLCVARMPADLDGVDAVILPGSKSVVADLRHLRESCLDQRLLALAADGKTEIIGICGGYQMLGRLISDPHGIESSARSTPGLGLLPVETTLMPEKILARVEAMHVSSGLNIRGYEIHHGQSRIHGGEVAIRNGNGEPIGVQLENGRIWGTYLHGVFDDDRFRRQFIDGIRSRRRLPPMGKVLAVWDLEPALDRLAQAVRSAVDIARIYRDMGLR